ncbi:unnamed protein product, partial [Ectocarpus sp. 8 AP-2014]
TRSAIPPFALAGPEPATGTAAAPPKIPKPIAAVAALAGAAAPELFRAWVVTGTPVEEAPLNDDGGGCCCCREFGAPPEGPLADGRTAAVWLLFLFEVRKPRAAAVPTIALTAGASPPTPPPLPP